MATKPNQSPIYRRILPFLVAMREEAGLTQRALAKKVRKPQWWVARIETGSRRVDIAEFVLWCQGCGQDPAAAITELGSGSR